MDVKIGDCVVAPRIGKPIEVNPVWYNTLRAMGNFAWLIEKPYKKYDIMAELAAVGFGRFWNDRSGYGCDVIDGPDGDYSKLRPNQIFGVSLPQSPIMPDQQRGIVDACVRSLLTSHGLRKLTPDHPQYKGH
jgi:predicted glycogen debranching enzyme